MTLKRLTQHNAERAAAAIRARNGGSKNGLECPQCGSEMEDSHPGVSLTTDPPQKQVHCPDCNRRDYAYI